MLRCSCHKNDDEMLSCVPNNASIVSMTIIFSYCAALRCSPYLHCVLHVSFCDCIPLWVHSTSISATLILIRTPIFFFMSPIFNYTFLQKKKDSKFQRSRTVSSHKNATATPLCFTHQLVQQTRWQIMKNRKMFQCKF